MLKTKIEQFDKKQKENFIKEQSRLASRINYEGPKWKWPINKLDKQMSK